MTERFLKDRVVLHCGDCREVLAQLDENSLDACCCDPPYHLTSIVKRFGGNGTAPAQYGNDGRYQRASAGFMGKQWDGGDIAFQPDTWRAVLRVLKPGAHALVFCIPKHIGFVQVAMQEAGFEFRDVVVWAFGSGFPKSHDVSKGIDRAAGAEREVIRKYRAATQTNNIGTSFNASAADEFGRTMASVTAPATLFSHAWEGWGTALKPAVELIVLARKPLSEGTIAANVLRWGTGAINVDGCRVTFTSDDDERESKTKNAHADFDSGPRENKIYGADNRARGANGNYNPPGRWPANLIHDGSAEVVAAFPESGPASSGGVAGWQKDGYVGGKYEPIERTGYDDNGGSAARFFYTAKSDKVRFSGTRAPRENPIYGKPNTTRNAPDNYGDQGSAARFFYTAKADSFDRAGSSHPTVKPLDLMQYLVRLITPPRGTVIDPFAGTGTTGEAAWREGMNAVLIEREAEYAADIRRRMALALSGPDERSREAIKAKNLPRDDGPLFASPESWHEMWGRPFDYSKLGNGP